MPGLIPENVLEDILSRIDIAEVISNYLPLKRAGRNFKANCPFHQEKTASFMVSSDKQIYHCFGCGESGNAFKFLMRFERLDFPEAVEVLAKKAGVAIPQNSDEKSEKTLSLSKQVYKINELAAAFYENKLHSQRGASAREYLLKRGLTQETIKKFGLGLASEKWDELLNFLRSKNAPLTLLEKCGLVLAKEGGGFYDRFRNRIIFPVLDIKSQVIGFGGRVIPDLNKVKEDDSQPKYINSPETPVYTKGRHLYGLNLAKDAIRQKDLAIVVEGYLDFILPFQAGCDNIAASLGTALTQEQVRLLKRYTHNVVMVYDGDRAGEMATLRSLDIFIEESVNVKVVSLPEGFDPDTFLRKNGADAFKEKISQSLNIFDYKLKVLKSRYSHKEIEGKAKISSEMLAMIKKFDNAVLRSEYLKRLADELNVKEEALWENLNKIKDIGRSPAANVKFESKQLIQVSPVEKLLIKLMLEEVEVIEQIKQQLEPHDFQSEPASRVVSTMFELAKQGKNIDKNVLINHLGDENILRLVCESAFLPEIESQDKEKVVNECIQRLKNEKLKFKKQKLTDEIKLAQNAGNEAGLNRLMQEFHLLSKKGHSKNEEKRIR